MAPSPIRTTDLFDQLTADLQAIRELSTQRFRSLTDEQLNRRPGPGKWSVGQCLEHLNIIGGLYLPEIHRKLQRAKQRSTKPAEMVRRGIVGPKLIESMRTPASEHPLQTPQQYAPSGSRLPRTVVEVFHRQLDEFQNIIQQARSVNANAVRIANPIVPLLFLRLPDQLEFIVVHAQRHMKQAERVLNEQKGASVVEK